MPDAWGRAAMERRVERPLREDEILLATPDTRVGALGFGPTLAGPHRETPWAPSLEALDRLDLRAAVEAYAALRAGDLREMDEAMRRLVLPGSSLGGARPKATVVIDDALWIAKFGRSEDPFDYPRAEWATMQLAARCGVEVPEVGHEVVGGRGAFLIRRFDRDGSRRSHLNSMLALLGETELSFFHSSYMDMADACVHHVAEDGPARRELFRRMVFNGRRLSIGCGLDVEGRVTRAFTLEGALRAAPRFGLRDTEAAGIIQEVERGVAAWREVFASTGMSARELEMFGRVIEGASRGADDSQG